MKKDEISESSWLMNWLSSKTAEEYKSSLGRQFNIRLTQSETVVRVDILELDGEPAESMLAEQLRKGLVLELR